MRIDHAALYVADLEAARRFLPEDAVAARLVADGHRVVNGPRTTGDGYYEAVVLDGEGNEVEIVA